MNPITEDDIANYRSPTRLTSSSAMPSCCRRALTSPHGTVRSACAGARPRCCAKRSNCWNTRVMDARSATATRTWALPTGWALGARPVHEQAAPRCCKPRSRAASYPFHGAAGGHQVAGVDARYGTEAFARRRDEQRKVRLVPDSSRIAASIPVLGRQLAGRQRPWPMSLALIPLRDGTVGYYQPCLRHAGAGLADPGSFNSDMGTDFSSASPLARALSRLRHDRTHGRDAFLLALRGRRVPAGGSHCGGWRLAPTPLWCSIRRAEELAVLPRSRRQTASASMTIWQLRAPPRLCAPAAIPHRPRWYRLLRRALAPTVGMPTMVLSVGASAWSAEA